MIRLFAVVAVIAALSIGLGARAQDGATPVAEDATPGLLYCATPLADAGGETPVSTVIAPPTDGSPGAFEGGTPIGLFACGTPDASPQSTPATPAG